MALSLYDIAVPSITRALRQLTHILEVGERFAAEKGIDPSELVNARLIEDMRPFSSQVQLASDSAKGAVGRLSGQTAPSMPDTETTFAELKDRVARTLAFVESVGRDSFDGPDDRAIELKLPNRTLQFTAATFLMGFVLPNLYFHITTAYDILRSRGAPLGKPDYLGAV